MLADRSSLSAAIGVIRGEFLPEWIDPWIKKSPPTMGTTKYTKYTKRLFPDQGRSLFVAKNDWSESLT